MKHCAPASPSWSTAASCAWAAPSTSGPSSARATRWRPRWPPRRAATRRPSSRWWLTSSSTSPAPSSSSRTTATRICRCRIPACVWPTCSPSWRKPRTSRKWSSTACTRPTWSRCFWPSPPGRAIPRTAAARGSALFFAVDLDIGSRFKAGLREGEGVELDHQVLSLLSIVTLEARFNTGVGSKVGGGGGGGG